MELTDLIPLNQIEAALQQPLRVERLGTADRQRFLRRDPDALFGIAAAAWHHLVEAGHLKVDPMVMRAYFIRSDPGLAKAIEGLIGEPLFKELGFLEAVVDHSDSPFVVATSCAVHLYSDELHFYDINVADPRRPIGKARRKSPSQHHRGFGLLPVIMANVLTVASERGCSTITLTAAYRPLVSVFERYGFAVEDNELARRALASGVGIPMARRAR